MNIRLGEKIRTLRKARNISQEKLASYLGVSFQSVSKWENSITMPDVVLIPAIASFFGVSTDELFDFNTLEKEKRIAQICTEAAKYRGSDAAKAENILRDALKQYPGDDILLNNLLYTMRSPERADEVIDLCTALIEATRLDDVKYDTLRILAETYKENGEYALAKATIERIPEIYFTKLQLDALLLEGEDMYHSAYLQRNLSGEMLIDMTMRLADYCETKGETEKARAQLETVLRIVEVLKDDTLHCDTEPCFYDYYGKAAEEEARRRLSKSADLS